MATAVVIPTFNRRETLSSALESLCTLLPSGHYVIVVDSGSTDGTSRMVREKFPQVVLVEGDSSLWWAAATNAGIRKAKELGCTCVVTYNDDNIATPGLFARLADAAKFCPRSIVAAVCCYHDRPDTVFFAGRMRAKGSDRFYYLDHDVPLSSLNKGIREVDLLHGMCTLFPMTVLDTVGLFDELTFPQLFADDDLCLRAIESGFHLRVALDATVLNDRTKTGINPYDLRLGPVGVLQLLTSRKSTFQLAARTRFLWRHRRSLGYFFKTWFFDYVRMFTLILARWILPTSAFHWLGKKWAQRLNRP
jgi:GT2 family glycosyltransferase